jgi:hypothetical protein
MDLLKSYGNVIYGLTTLAAFLGGFLVSLVLLGGFFYASLAGGEPGGADRRYTVVASAGILATATLFVGLLGVSSKRQAFPIVTILSAGFLLCLLVPYAAEAVRGEALLWTLFMVVVEFSALTLSALKLKQLRTAR